MLGSIPEENEIEIVEI
jgi:hypothetical protein